MSFADHVVLWLHLVAAIFTIGPGTAAIMSTPRYIRRQNTVLVGYLYRTTRIYSIAALLTLIFGAVLAGMTHKFSQWWISVSLTLFVVAFVLLMLIIRDQRTALTALTTADDTVAAERGSTRSAGHDGRLRHPADRDHRSPDRPAAGGGRARPDRDDGRDHGGDLAGDPSADGLALAQHQRPVQVGQQVRRVLDANRKPHQVRRHGQRGLGDGGVRHPRRVLDQRLDAAERLAQGEQPGAPADADGRLFPAAHLE